MFIGWLWHAMILNIFITLMIFYNISITFDVLLFFIFCIYIFYFFFILSANKIFRSTSIMQILLDCLWIPTVAFNILRESKSVKPLVLYTIHLLKEILCTFLTVIAKCNSITLKRSNSRMPKRENHSLLYKI